MDRGSNRVYLHMKERDAKELVKEPQPKPILHGALSVSDFSRPIRSKEEVYTSMAAKVNYYGSP